MFVFAIISRKSYLFPEQICENLIFYIYNKYQIMLYSAQQPPPHPTWPHCRFITDSCMTVPSLWLLGT
jgi:hypothetical protein